MSLAVRFIGDGFLKRDAEYSQRPGRSSITQAVRSPKPAFRRIGIVRPPAAA
jgi:hypothetical protein